MNGTERFDGNAGPARTGMMKKAIIIGCPGSGKSTFARALHQATGLPLFYLDMMNWNADHTEVPDEVFQRRLQEAISGERWIIDGNYGSTIELRLRACDTVFFLDYPLETCLDGIRSRKGQKRPDIPWENDDGESDEKFIDFIKNYRAVSRPKVLSLLEKYHDRNIVVFHRREEADAYLRGLQGAFPQNNTI